MKTLKDIISKEEELAANSNDIDIELVDPTDALQNLSRRLMCIVTAFELLSGQGTSLLASDVNVSDCHLNLRRSIEHRSVRIRCNVVC
jgi:hypothetical protein